MYNLKIIGSKQIYLVDSISQFTGKLIHGDHGQFRENRGVYKQIWHKTPFHFAF